MKPANMVIVFFSLLILTVPTGCENPCQKEINAIKERVMRFIVDPKPLDQGIPEPCDTDSSSPGYDQICDFAVKALSTRWPYYDCNSCDALQIKLCACYRDEVWVVDNARQPIYPGLVYCLANAYRLRELCACDPTWDPYQPYDCYRGDGSRVCQLPPRPAVKQPNLQQTDACDALIGAFACVNYDADSDGIPDQYDGGQDRIYFKYAEDPDCLNGPPGSEAWDRWLDSPISLYDGGEIFIDADGGPEDRDGDGVSDYCDNCPDVPNGFDCTKVIEGQRAFELRCDVNLDGVVGSDELNLGNQMDSDGDFAGDACDPD